MRKSKWRPKVNNFGLACLDRALDYADGVSTGRIVACRYVQLAVERWFNDHRDGESRGIYFDGNVAAEFFSFGADYCRHYQGVFAGEIIHFDGWQCFILANIFGWLRVEDGSRRFRTVYEEVARKNGKTTKLAAVGTYLVVGDCEPGAKVYCAATKRDQAKEIFDSISMMAKQDPQLSLCMNPMRTVINAKAKNSPNSRVELLSADYDTLDGLNVHGALVDELHAHKDSGVWDVLESARGSRRQPVMWGITTAGKNQNGFCYEQRGYAIKVLEGSVENDAFFAIIFTLDEDDDWEDETCWQKSNPGLGVSVSLSDMREQAAKAKEVPTAQIEFKTKRLNVWVYGESAWMNMLRWNACRDNSFEEKKCWSVDSQSELEGLTCYGGIDLASIEDLSSFSLDFRLPDGKHTLISRSYLPQEAFDARMQKGGMLRGLYQKFRDEGMLVVTPGARCDYEFIQRDVMAACERFNVKEIGFDRFNSSQLVTNLMSEGVPMVQMGQGTGSISAPMKEMMRLTLGGEVRHNNSLLSFAMSNLVATINAAGDIKYDKSKVSEKIDPACASIMALGRSMVFENDEQISDVDSLLGFS